MKKTFENYKPQNQSQEKALKALKTLAEYIKETGKIAAGSIIYIQGETGVGKTHLVEAFLNETSKIKSLVFSPKDVSSGYMPFGIERDRPKILVLEDILEDFVPSKNYDSSKQAEFLKNLFVEIYEKGYMAIITGPRDFQILVDISTHLAKERISCRILKVTENCKPIIITGTSYRKLYGVV